MSDGQGYGFVCSHILRSENASEDAAVRLPLEVSRVTSVAGEWGEVCNIRVASLRIVGVRLLEAAYASTSSRPVVRWVYVPWYGRCSELFWNGKGDALQVETTRGQGVAYAVKNLASWGTDRKSL